VPAKVTGVLPQIGNAYAANNNRNHRVAHDWWFVSFASKRMQRRAIAAGAQLKFNPFRKFIESSHYVIAVRLLGVTCILVALLLTFAIIKW
jgi:hypothetical protein